MAQRRMFSKDITEHDSFLAMPLSTQSLYFHLGMQADDDGFVSPNRILRMIGAQLDDLNVLIAKRYIMPFDDGIVVIKHWKMNNYLRPDRYKATKHQEKMALLKEKTNGSYSWYTSGIPVGIPSGVQLVDAGKVRIGKDSITAQSAEALEANQNDMTWKERRYSDDYELEAIQADPDYKPKRHERNKVPDDIQQVFDLFSNPARVTWRLREIERVAAKALFDTYGLDTLKKRIDRIELEKKKNADDPYFPLVNTPSTLLDKMEAVERYLKL